ncbi:MAG TPA: hypothetical protein EYQ85_05365 [Candidatus Poseidoniales archaeon]|nr:MAG: hypothetical protein CXT68_02120 [Euryarchaeota archaeon]HIF16659.1 hypothetical protein [Candidatus Poseidoniales archaeon]
MSEEKKAPPSIVLGLLDDEEETPPTVDLGIGESVPMATTELEDDEDIAEFADSFSGSISPKGSETADSKQTEPEAGKMKKKDFWLGVFAPIGLLILASSIYNWLDGVSHYENGLKGVNLYGDSGNFTIDTLEFGVDCNEDTYDFRIYYYDVYGNVIDLRDGDYYGSSFGFSCGEEWTIAQSDFVGYWEANGTLNLSLPYAPENGTEVIVGWNNSVGLYSIGTGNGVRTNFSVDAGERHGGPFDEWTFIGKYDCTNCYFDDGWDEVTVYKTSEGLWWHNEADAVWRLYWEPNSWDLVDGNSGRDMSSCAINFPWGKDPMKSGTLRSGEESPYGEQALYFHEDSFDALCFNGWFYALIEGVEMGASYDHCSQLTVELVDDEGNQTEYWNGGEFGSCYSNMGNPDYDLDEDECGMNWPEDPFHAAIYSFIAEYELEYGASVGCFSDDYPDQTYEEVSIDLEDNWASGTALEYAQAWVDSNAADYGQESFNLTLVFNTSGGGLGWTDTDAWSLILSADVELVRNFGKDGPMSFQLPSDHEDIDRIEISAYSESIAQEYQDGQREARDFEDTLETSFTVLLVLGIPAMLIAAFVTGHKWFAYGFLTMSISATSFFFIAFGPFALFYLFGGIF